MSKANKKILIVEDDKSFLWILKQSFSDEGFSVSFAEDGEEGLKMVEKEKPDLILLDIMLPKMDGIKVAEKLKEKGDTTKIIFLTNLKDTEHIIQAVEKSKEIDYIIKSDMDVAQIIERVKQRLRIE
jgi:two-component system response regulator VicR